MDKIKNVSVHFLNSVNKAVIREFTNLSPSEANLIIPTDGYVRIEHKDYKVKQIVKSIYGNAIDDTLVVNVFVFVDKISKNDYYLFT